MAEVVDTYNVHFLKENLQEFQANVIHFVICVKMKLFHLGIRE